MKMLSRNLILWLLSLGLVWPVLGAASESSVDSQLQESRVFSVSADDGIVNLGDLEYRLTGTVQFDGRLVSADEALTSLSRHVERVVWVYAERVDGQRLIRIIETKR